MSADIIYVGPLLGIESDERYTFCFLTDDTVESVSILVNGESNEGTRIFQRGGRAFWRVESTLSAPAGDNGLHMTYEVLLDGNPGRDLYENASWKFYLPGSSEAIRIAYASCNGFEDTPKHNLSEAYDLWGRMQVNHDHAPYSLLLMGGDQVYCDKVWDAVPKLDNWTSLSPSEKLEAKACDELRNQLEDFYLHTIYSIRWQDPRMAAMLASVPSIMMWDDHDIFDGWGSLDKDLQNSEVYQAIFTAAKRYFEAFQVRSNSNSSLLARGERHYSMAVSFRGHTILALDNRSERTRKEIMTSGHWAEIKDALSSIAPSHHLIVMSAVPVVYRDFGVVESVMRATPWTEELEDDVMDHWRAKEHAGERLKLINNLLKSVDERDGRRTLILSGDVHIGCAGVIRRPLAPASAPIYQLVSSGIVHPPPSVLEWAGILAVTNDRPESLEAGSVSAELINIPSVPAITESDCSSASYIRSQNFLSLEPGDDGKLWIAWECKDGERPLIAIA